MVRVVLDTNVVLSGLLWHGIPSGIWNHAAAGVIHLFSSDALIDELLDVLHRPKFSKSLMALGHSAEELVAHYKGSVVLVESRPIAPVIVADPDDDQVLACAIAAAADLIVSGDPHLVDLKSHCGIPILTPSEFLRKLPQSEQS